jgi:prolyl-tRNA synthetase
MFIPTVKEVPADAEIASHQLMIRAALIRKVASGTYTYLPLGWRSLLKIIAIVRQEMDKAGAQEILVPSMQPLELCSWPYRRRGRYLPRRRRDRILQTIAYKPLSDKSQVPR